MKLPIPPKQFDSNPPTVRKAVKPPLGCQHSSSHPSSPACSLLLSIYAVTEQQHSAQAPRSLPRQHSSGAHLNSPRAPPPSAPAQPTSPAAVCSVWAGHCWLNRGHGACAAPCALQHWLVFSQHKNPCLPPMPQHVSWPQAPPGCASPRSTQLISPHVVNQPPVKKHFTRVTVLALCAPPKSRQKPQ